MFLYRINASNEATKMWPISYKVSNVSYYEDGLLQKQVRTIGISYNIGHFHTNFSLKSKSSEKSWLDFNAGSLCLTFNLDSEDMILDMAYREILSYAVDPSGVFSSV
jgi:hypothetical protein